MIKNVFMYIIVIAIVAVGIWLFMQKGTASNKNMLNATPTTSETPSVSATPTASAAPSATPKVVHTETKPDGLKIEDFVVGTGATAKAGQMVAVNYSGWLTNGTKFDSNVDPAFGHVEPFTFSLGAGQVIQGWDEGVAGMKVGGKRRLTIPAAIGYGASGAGDAIPPNATLVFEVELLGVQ